MKRDSTAAAAQRLPTQPNFARSKRGIMGTFPAPKILASRVSVGKCSRLETVALLLADLVPRDRKAGRVKILQQRR